MASAGEQIVEEAMASKDPVKLRWDLSKSAVASLADVLIQRSKQTLDRVVAAAGRGQLTWEAILQPIADDEACGDALANSCCFPQYVSPDKALREACADAERALRKYSVEADSRKDVYQAVKAFAASAAAAGLEGERRRFLDRKLRDCRRLGLDLEAAAAERVRRINSELSDLAVTFSRNLQELGAKISFRAAELRGCPQSFLDGLKREGDGAAATYTLSYDPTDCIPVMEQCTVPETRRRMEFGYNTRCIAENSKILEEMVALRHEKAQLLGYGTHAAFITETRMARTDAAVQAFLADLSARLSPAMEREVAQLLELKREECAELGCEFDGKINAWDRSHLLYLLARRRHRVDHEKLKEYFPLELVLEGVLGIYQDILGLKFSKVDIPVWCEDVQAYFVADADTGRAQGYFYMDLWPREGKQDGACCWGLQPGCRASCAPDGEQLPVAAIVCCFPRPRAGSPGLLSHSEVETFFHEFGHLMHRMCARTELALFSGTAVESDFVEAPSQMLENWLWEPEALDRVSGHYRDSAQKIPRDLIASLIGSRNAGVAIRTKRQIALAAFDLTIHRQGKVDSAAVLEQELRANGFEVTPGTNFAAHFEHLTGNYDARYYGYLWSEVYAADMFHTRFRKDGIFSKEAGRDYRNEVLRHGGSRDAADLLRAFLGREPSSDAFLVSKGLSA
eukprot:TRINITY_DN8430_c0_g1_i1.p1 TRINITY_DN8430_c0_g1~~TRINITY_DN8430_c0_g1_i1.p1  ORF type:complete len:712 (+),score=252.46 TRINITY_DN8430_c0_g1_i1:93-2138(+)